VYGMKYIVVEVVEKLPKPIAVLIVLFLVYGFFKYVGHEPTEGGKEVTEDNKVVVTPNDYISSDYCEFVSEETETYLVKDLIKKYKKQGKAMTTEEDYDEEKDNKYQERKYIQYDGYVSEYVHLDLPNEYVKYKGKQRYAMDTTIRVKLAKDYENEKELLYEISTEGKLTVKKEKFLFWNYFDKSYKVEQFKIKEIR
jgi:hypothetical protein